MGPSGLSDEHRHSPSTELLIQELLRVREKEHTQVEDTAFNAIVFTVSRTSSRKNAQEPRQLGKGLGRPSFDAILLGNALRGLVLTSPPNLGLTIWIPSLLSRMITVPQASDPRDHLSDLTRHTAGYLLEERVVLCDIPPSRGHLGADGGVLSAGKELSIASDRQGDFRHCSVDCHSCVTICASYRSSWRGSRVMNLKNRSRKRFCTWISG